MNRSLALALAVLAALAVIAYSSSGGGQTGARAAQTTASRTASDAREARDAALVTPPVPDRGAPTEAPAAEAPPAADAAGATPEPPDVDPTGAAPIVVTLYQHATHDPQFPGERWLVGAGLTRAGPALRANEASAIEIPDGVVVTLFDEGGPFEAGNSGPEPTSVELGPGLHNLAPHHFNDRVDAVEVKRVARAAFGEGRRQPAAVTVLEAVGSAGERLGRMWPLRLGEGAATQLFTARDGDYDGDAMRALWVPARHEVILFVEPDGRGRAFALGPGRYDLGELGLLGGAASIRVLREVGDERAR